MSIGPRGGGLLPCKKLPGNSCPSGSTGTGMLRSWEPAGSPPAAWSRTWTCITCVRCRLGGRSRLRVRDRRTRQCRPRPGCLSRRGKSARPRCGGPRTGLIQPRLTGPPGRGLGRRLGCAGLARPRMAPVTGPHAVYAALITIQRTVSAAPLTGERAATARARFSPPRRRWDGIGGAYAAGSAEPLAAAAGTFQIISGPPGLGARTAAGPGAGSAARCLIGDRGLPGGDLSEAVSFRVFRDAGLDTGLHAGQEPGEAERPDQCLVQAESRGEDTMTSAA